MIDNSSLLRDDVPVHPAFLILSVVLAVLAFVFFAWIFLSGSKRQMELELAYAHYLAVNQLYTGRQERERPDEAAAQVQPSVFSPRQRPSGLAERRPH